MTSKSSHFFCVVPTPVFNGAVWYNKNEQIEVNGLAEKYDWLNIKKEYVTGKLTYDDLVKKYGMQYKTLSQRAAREGWVKEREKYRAEIERISLEKEAKKKAREMAKAEKSVNKVCDRLLEKISEMIDRVKSAKDLKSLTSALSDVQKLKGIKSDADRKEQEARIKALLHSVEKDINAESKTVEVIIEGAQEYAE